MAASVWSVPVLQNDEFQNLAMIGYGDGKLTCCNSSMETWTGGNREDNEDVNREDNEGVAPCFQLQSTVEKMMPITVILI